MLNEYNKYMNEPSAGIKEDIFEWWFKRKQLYPKLYSLVAKYLIIPATSADSERVFSLPY